MALKTLRVASDDGFERLLELLVAYESDLPPDLRHGSVPALESLRASSAGRSGAFLAVRDGEPIGCVAVNELDDETAVLRRLFVAPDHRGVGAARLLVETALTFLEENGYRRVVLDTEKERLRQAYDLYRSFGFEECAAYAEVDYRFPTFMELRLTPGQ